MIGEPDAGKPHVRFDEGVQETCDIAARLRPTLQRPAYLTARLLRGIKHSVRCTSSLRQYEVREVFEHPVVLQRSVDDPQELARQSDNRLSGPSPRLDPFVVPIQIRAVSLCDQRTLHQGG